MRPSLLIIQESKARYWSHKPHISAQLDSHWEILLIARGSQIMGHNHITDKEAPQYNLIAWAFKHRLKYYQVNIVSVISFFRSLGLGIDIRLLSWNLKLTNSGGCG